jgi:hypothetical protein
MNKNELNIFFSMADQKQIEAKFFELATSKEPSSIDSLQALLQERIQDAYPDAKHLVPRLAALALISKGAEGVSALMRTFPHAPGSIYPTSIIESLWHASNASVSITSTMLTSETTRSWVASIPDEARVAARNELNQIVHESMSSEELFDRLMQFLWQEAKFGVFSSADPSAFRKYFYESFAQAHIKLNYRVIANFKNLISKSEREEEYQQFLTEHPEILDPLAAQVISKQKLGIDHITDFVIKRLDNKYVLVEIEKPQDPIFTKSGNFSAKFTHALGQILDFQQWIDSNHSYADKCLPGISSPVGLLVMGRSSFFNAGHAAKLHRFNMNSSKIVVLTYDDLVGQSEILCKNLLGSQ